MFGPQRRSNRAYCVSRNSTSVLPARGAHDSVILGLRTKTFRGHPSRQDSLTRTRRMLLVYPTLTIPRRQIRKFCFIRSWRSVSLTRPREEHLTEKFGSVLPIGRKRALGHLDTRCLQRRLKDPEFRCHFRPGSTKTASTSPILNLGRTVVHGVQTQIPSQL